VIRPCTDGDIPAIDRIVNAAAQAYRGIIPSDRWHEPYMPREELESEIAAGVRFWCLEDSGGVVGVMGLQDVKDVTLIRHAYVLVDRQRSGVGSALMKELVAKATRPLLVGTWAAADWAIRFYERHGFELVSPPEKDRLLDTYWSIPARQRDTSVVLRKR
jgi:N-acetylglutamate synthase-like GNAT family acetyltransferase